MAGQERARIERLQSKMAAAGIDALVCKLPENVVYLTDYWPHHGFSVAVLPRTGKPALFVPEVELEYTRSEWADVTTFGWGLLKDGDLYENYRRLISGEIARLGLAGAAIGVELSFEIVAPTYRMAEPVVPSGPWRSLMAELCGEAHLVDATDFLQGARATKSAYELEKLRTANEIAEMGLRAALGQLEPGMSEAQVGALVEYHIRANGPGHNGARLVRAEAEVGAGPVGSTKGTLLVPSSGYQIQLGDLVMIELATMADGYFSDLTYMGVVGEPDPKQKEIYNYLLEAQQAAAGQVCPGNAFDAPDRAARQVLQKAGLEAYFVHITGHGVGLRYHEFVPFLAPGSAGTFEEGMVTSVEPGVYIPGFGGMRIEDNVAVGPAGPIFLSTPRQPW
ncbi:MAG: aminopeptidase P family protein [Chloroflexi bacterium]|nr:aminopeptidase P family protein [Chloroflexota bacterium]